MLGRRGIVAVAAALASMASIAIDPQARADEPAKAPAPIDGAMCTDGSTGQCWQGGPAKTDDHESTGERRVWYGGPMLAIDLAASAVALSTLAIHDDDRAVGVLAGLAGAAYTIGGPAVHGANGRGVMSLASLGLRIGAPAALMGTGIAVGMAADPSCREGEEFCGLAAVVFGAAGFLAGIVSAAAVDDAVFAWKPATAAAVRPATGLGIESFTPVLGMVRDERQHRLPTWVPTFGVAAVF